MKLFKNFCSLPLLIPGVFNLINSLFKKKSNGFICCWHDLSAEIFQSHIEALQPNKPIPLDELTERLKSGKSTSGCYALTFDDGVGSTVRDISNKCIQKGWPVTFYLPTQYLDEGILPYQNSKPISWSEVEELSKNQLISFQSHGVTHSAVSSLNEEEIELEMTKSKKIIESHTNKKVHSFCYPYGSKESIGNMAPKVAAKHFSSAVTLIHGRLKKNDLFYLPRIGLYKEDLRSLARLKTLI
tara:strand:- start:1617 stop:2342 length:726 start_codon:yes stop_codon:yes gene_type:complete